MNGIHDMGGMHGFGPVVVPGEDGPFHEAWEGRTFAMSLLAAATVGINLDESRREIESPPQAQYLSLGYYGRWLRALEHLLVEKGALAPGELDARLNDEKFSSQLEFVPTQMAPEDFVALRPVERPALFSPGDRVRVRNIHPSGHTRLPRYVRGRIGMVDRVQPSCVFPDSRARGQGDDPQHLYCVRFQGQELWGSNSEPGLVVFIDLFEPYLESP